jgi:omega-hydroxy-beta-dihydromenaquinone-9 sulfotransferase
METVTNLFKALEATALENVGVCAAVVVCLVSIWILRRKPRDVGHSEYTYGKLYRFEVKHEYEMKNNILSGITLFNWLQILWRRLYDIDYGTYWARILFITSMSCFNSAVSCVEWVLYGKYISDQPINQRPVFILGHPRTGTTHLFNLLSRDVNRFTYTSTLCAGFPGGYLLLKPYVGLLNGVIDKKRPMDNMALDLDCPQEDELGTNVLSCGMSYYQAIVFMRNEKDYRRYITFENATEKEKSLWLNAFKYMCKKATYSSIKGQDPPSAPPRLLMKSPVHTGRIKFLLQLFPEAEFIYIHRHPYDVFLSAARMADTAYWYSNLSVPCDAEIIEFILWQYECLLDEYIEGRKMLSKNQIFELSFDELNSNPLQKVEDIYQHFDWKGFQKSGVKSDIAAYLDSLKGYKKSTKRQELTDEQKRLIHRRWNKCFEEFHYEP